MPRATASYPAFERGRTCDGGEALPRRRHSEPGGAGCYAFVLTTPMTDAKGTSSPSLYHHLASHMWHVVKDRSLPAASMPIVMRSPVRHSGQLRSLGVSGIMLQSSASRGAEPIAHRVHFRGDTRRLLRSGALPTRVPPMGTRRG